MGVFRPLPLLEERPSQGPGRVQCQPSGCHGAACWSVRLCWSHPLLRSDRRELPSCARGPDNAADEGEGGTAAGGRGRAAAVWRGSCKPGEVCQQERSYAHQQDARDLPRVSGSEPVQGGGGVLLQARSDLRRGRLGVERGREGSLLTSSRRSLGGRGLGEFKDISSLT
eukprot:397732-Hanusia_phi.AAC.1